MTRIASIAAAAATLLAATAAPAFAGDQTLTQAVVQPASQPAARHVVMLCGADEATERSLRREYGTRLPFVTADQVLTARGTGVRWATPRCMTAREHGRLVQALNTYAAVR